MDDDALTTAQPEDDGGIFGWLGEQVGRFLAELPGAITNFFGGVGEGAGVSGFFDWAALLIGLGMILSAAKGFKDGKIVSSVVGGAIGVALMGWAIS